MRREASIKRISVSQAVEDIKVGRTTIANNFERMILKEYKNIPSAEVCVGDPVL